LASAVLPCGVAEVYLVD